MPDMQLICWGSIYGLKVYASILGQNFHKDSSKAAG